VGKRKLLLVIGSPGFINSATGRRLSNAFDIVHAERFTIDTILSGTTPDLAIINALSVRDDPSVTIPEIQRMRDILPVIAIGRESAPEMSGCKLAIGMTLSEAKIHLIALVELLLTLKKVRFAQKRIAVEVGTLNENGSSNCHIALIRNSTDDYKAASDFLAGSGPKESMVLFGPRTYNENLLRRIASATEVHSSRNSTRFAVIDTNRSTFYMMQTLLRTIESISAKGFSARVLAHIPNNTFRRSPSRLRLEEQFLNAICGYIPAVVVCEYDRHNLEGFNFAMRTHPLVISNGHLVRNPLYGV